MGLGLPNPYTLELISTFKKQPAYRISLFLPTYLDNPKAIPQDFSFLSPFFTLIYLIVGQVRYFQRRTDADAAYPVLRVRGALESLNRGEPRNFAAAVAVTLHHPEKSPLNTTHLRHQYQRLLRSTGDIGSNHTSTARPRPFSTVNTAEPRPRQQPMRIQAHS
ncbi:hypothetical protein CMEL01_11298 [Colletotrichum melonis]|uniref:Uncharacterized protein n=1 Tax=Colletotrichum melonis TaxID=1209925 RepID=A0AAI9V142_9PEZI|nr:hypothetical protein CMEL01_11298 [Colletotrichum melonis]